MSERYVESCMNESRVKSLVMCVSGNNYVYLLVPCIQMMCMLEGTECESALLNGLEISKTVGVTNLLRTDCKFIIN